MKKLENILRFAIFIELIVGGLRSLWCCVDYWLHPAKYVVQSAPWYLGCIAALIATAGFMGITYIIYLIVRYANRKQK